MKWTVTVKGETKEFLYFDNALADFLGRGRFEEATLTQKM